MKLIAQVKLLPTEQQADALRRTLGMANDACNYLSTIAYEAKAFHQYVLHKLAYRQTRDEFPELSAQAVVRCIAKVADAYKVSRYRQATFKTAGGIAYDDRILHWYTARREVSIWTVDGRCRIPYAAGERQLALLETRQGESDLILSRGEFYLLATCNVEDPPPALIDDVLGVDLGIVNLAADSDGETFGGEQVERQRRIHAHRRRNLQRKGTKSAKRKLKKLSGKQARFQRDTNHVISKRIVQKAQDTNRAIAVENLTGIRQRTTVRRKERARHANWSFYQLKQFIAYKAQRAGIPVIEVDPRYTSQTCPVCGCVDRRNRRDQATFSCISCGFSSPADTNAAVNIAARAAVNRPMVSALAG